MLLSTQESADTISLYLQVELVEDFGTDVLVAQGVARNTLVSHTMQGQARELTHLMHTRHRHTDRHEHHEQEGAESKKRRTKENKRKSKR